MSVFPHYKVDEQPNKSPKRVTSQKEEKAMTRMLWLLSKVYHNWVAFHKIQMHSFLKVESLGRARCRKSWNQLQRVRFTKSTLRQASIKEKKGPSLGKINVKVPHQRRPYAMKFVDRSHEETEDNSDVPEARLGILPKTFTSSKRTTKLHSIHLPIS